MKISLCLIVWNELRGCKIDLPNLPLIEFDEVFAIDGGSTDGTVEYLEAAGITVYHQQRPGLNAAYILAHEVAINDFIVVFFPKGTLEPNAVLNFQPYFEENCQLVVASRQINGSSNEEDTKRFKPRKWGVWCLSVLAAIVWRREGVWIRDVLHGVKGWQKNAFKQMQILDYGLSIDIEMVIRSYKLKMKRAEFPVKEISRLYGSTHFKILPTGKRLLMYLWFELFRNESTCETKMSVNPEVKT